MIVLLLWLSFIVVVVVAVIALIITVIVVIILLIVMRAVLRRVKTRKCKFENSILWWLQLSISHIDINNEDENGWNSTL